MTTSGTTSFNLELDELFDEAFGRVGIGGTRSGYHLRAARRIPGVIQINIPEGEDVNSLFASNQQHLLTEKIEVAA